MGAALTWVRYKVCAQRGFKYMYPIRITSSVSLRANHLRWG